MGDEVVPVRIPSTVVEVTVERASISAVVHVTARDSHRSHVSLPPFIVIGLHIFQRAPSRHDIVRFLCREGMRGRSPPVPLEMVIFLLEGDRGRPSAKTQHRCRRYGRTGQQKGRCPRYRQREPLLRLRLVRNSQENM